MTDNISPGTSDLPPRARRLAIAPRLAERLTGQVLPLGLFLVLTGLTWSPQRSLYHQIFYWLLALPTLVLVAVRPGVLAQLARSPVFVAFAAFAGYMSLSILWSGPDGGDASLLKRPLYILLLFVAMAEVARSRPDRLDLAMRAAALFAVAAAAVLLSLFLWRGSADARLSGFGALSNPLLTSHVFGFFLALWLAYWTIQRKLLSPLPLAALLVLGALIVATGSRTPLVALTATVLWLCVLSPTRQGMLACLVVLAMGAILAVAWPQALLQRGMSYRPEIWSEALRLISEHPIIGHGYGESLRVKVGEIAYAFWDPHNISLSVLYRGGLVGLVLWVALYAVALTLSWRRRGERNVLIASAPVVYGLVAGMTEGGAFLSGPKEHWFLIWIPFALLTAALGKDDQKSG